MKKPDITVGRWKAQSMCVVSVDEDVTICDCNVDGHIEVDNQVANQYAISAVPKMIDALIDARKAIYNTNKELFGLGVLTDSNGEEQIYFLKDELLQNIDEALKKAGVEL